MDADLPQAVPIHDAGYNVLMFNMRAHGTSDGKHVTFGVFEKEDLLGAIDFLRAEKGVEHVAILGMSMGAGVAMIAAALSHHVDALILDGIFERFLTTVQAGIRNRGIPRPLDTVLTQLAVLGAALLTNTRMYQVSPLLWAKHLKDVPVLFIHAENDQFVSLEGLQRLAADLNGEHKIWIARDCKHREGFSKHREAYLAEVTGWLEQYHTNNRTQGRDTSRPLY